MLRLAERICSVMVTWDLRALSFLCKQHMKVLQGFSHIALAARDRSQNIASRAKARVSASRNFFEISMHFMCWLNEKEIRLKYIFMKV